MVHWSGELGFAGAGYQTTQRGVTTVRLLDGAVVPASVTIEQRLTDRKLEAYVVVAPGYIAAHSTDHLLRDAWDVVCGHSGPYFVERVVVPSPVPSTGLEGAINSTDLRHLLEEFPVMPGQVTTAVGPLSSPAVGQIQADAQKAQLLLRVIASHPAADGTAGALLQAAHGIGSDRERGRVLSAMLRNGTLR